MTNGTTTWSFQYDANGLRTQRTDGTNTYKYYYTGDKLTAMSINGKPQWYYYDAAGTPYAMYYNGEYYYYMTNAQGDVTAIINSLGRPVAYYHYDAWGEHCYVTGNMAATIGQDNPIRYRGYVYDRETGLYYLQSRYYNPETGRFVNADALVATGQGVLGNNMFAYCGNNPVSRKDDGGAFWDTVFDVASLITSIVEVVKNPDDISAWLGLAGDLIDVAIPAVGGLGEIVDAANAARKAANAVDNTHDAIKIISGGNEVIDTASDVARRSTYYVTPGGVAIPSTMDDLSDNLLKLDCIDGKYYGADSYGPIRIRVSEIHSPKLNSSVPYDPFHTSYHFHIDRRAKGATGKWVKTYTGLMEMFE